MANSRISDSGGGSARRAARRDEMTAASMSMASTMATAEKVSGSVARTLTSWLAIARADSASCPPGVPLPETAPALSQETTCT
jgi:hypothetical protein